LARKLRELRSKRGLPRKRFTAKVGVTFSTVNGREPGRSSPSPLAMRRLLFARAGVVPVGDDRDGMRRALPRKVSESRFRAASPPAATAQRWQAGRRPLKSVGNGM